MLYEAETFDRKVTRDDLNALEQGLADVSADTIIRSGSNWSLGNSLGSITSGTNLMAIGDGALAKADTSTLCLAIGKNALAEAIGGGAGENVACLAVGYEALRELTTGDHNVAVGHRAGYFNQTGSANTVIGVYAGAATTINESSGHNNPSSNTFIGYYAGRQAQTGSQTAIGANALLGTTTGTANTAIGATALLTSTTGSNNVAIGTASMVNATTGTSNTAIGTNTMIGVVTGANNNAIGLSALGALTSGAGNSAVGVLAGGSIIGGSYNVAFGDTAGYGITNGSFNVCIGALAGYSDGVTATAGTRGNVTLIGAYAQATVDAVCVIGGKIAGFKQSLCLGNTGDIGGGLGVISVTTTTAPTTNPAAGTWILFVDPADNTLKARSSAGNVRTLAAP